MNWLIDWYASMCDGDWEHEYGVRIETLDNPGWMLTADLVGTPLEGREIEKTLDERSEDDWVATKTEGGRFLAAGGPKNLPELLAAFRAFSSDPVDPAVDDTP